MDWIKRKFGRPTFNNEEAKELETEIKKATVVNKEELPADIVRLNSMVTIKEAKEKRKYSLRW